MKPVNWRMIAIAQIDFLMVIPRPCQNIQLLRESIHTLSKLHALQGIPCEFEASARVKIAEVREKLGLDSLDNDYNHVAEAAKAVGLGDFFVSNNKLLSKFAHPMAGLVLGIMHQSETRVSLSQTYSYFYIDFCLNGLCSACGRGESPLPD